MQAGEYGRQIGHIKLFYDADAGKITQDEANVYETDALTQEGDSKAAAFCSRILSASMPFTARCWLIIRSIWLTKSTVNRRLPIILWI